ncbi:MAG TPA: hypothetical protein VHO48_10470 [Anaerolineaceae bacterium]|nr:hypothetical protein [Anaerolineaceae bacterium]
MIGDFLYQLTARDVQGATIEALSLVQVKTENAANVNLSYEVPAGKNLLLFNAHVDGIPDAAGVAVLNGFLIVAPPNVPSSQYVPLRRLRGTNTTAPGNPGTVGISSVFRTVAPATGGFDMQWPGILFPHNYRLIAQIGFDAAAAGNTVEFALYGLIIPHGNIVV